MFKLARSRHLVSRAISSRNAPAMTFINASNGHGRYTEVCWHLLLCWPYSRGVPQGPSEGVWRLLTSSATSASAGGCIVVAAPPLVLPR